MENGYEGYMAANMVIISVDEYDRTEMRGRLYHFYMEETGGKEFTGVIQMLQIMDDFFDSIHMPMRSMEERRFVNRRTIGGNESDKNEGTEKCEEAVTAEKTAEQQLHKQEAKNMAIKLGERATFVVHVCYRQNASWQGTVLWADEKKKVNFRSALELIKLMDSVLSEAEREV